MFKLNSPYITGPVPDIHNEPTSGSLDVILCDFILLLSAKNDY
jgi:hypothetical protein